MNGYDLILHFINLQYFYVTVDKMASFENENASQLNQQPIQAAPAPTHQLSLKDRILASIMSVPDDEDGHADKDICRVCRLAGEDTLYHPCLCTGSIKYVHQDCLLQWLKYSKKDVCELCNHKFSFRPLYRPDMPERLPLWDLLRGVFLIFARFMRLTLTYTLVASCWLGLVPLMAARTHRLVFSGLLSSVFSSRILQLFSPENVAVDIFRGSMVVTLFLATFISLVWLREQIMIGGPANFLHLQEPIPRPSEAALPPATGNNQAAPNQPPTPPPPNNQQIGETPGVQNTQTTAPADVGPGSNEVGDMINTAGLQSSTSTGHPIPSTSAAQIDEEQTPAEDAEQSTIAPTSTPPIRQSPPPFQQFQPLQPTLVVDHPMPAGQPQQGQQPPIDNQNQQQQAQQLAQNNGNGNNGVVAAAAEMEQQRFVDELTWQRLLGLDGSFAFIEHVFWTISLNFVFNFMFLYFPAQVGTSILTLFGYGPGKTQYFEMPIAIMAGLLIILLHGLVIHRVAKMFRLKSLYTISGMICLMLKVFLLVVTELVIFPVLCGWWLDICSLPLTGVTLEERLRNFRQYPSSSMFLHWLTGMIYVFYSASFILILRELLRPGVLWFIRNLHDPDFNPIQEMIEQPVAQHVRRLISSMTLFFSIIMLVIYIPLRVIKWLHPRTLPYVFTGSADTPLVEYSFELILLQVIMPTILEYSKVFSLLKRAVHLWCRIVGGWLQLDSYLLPTDRDRQDADQREQQRQRARDRLMRGDQNEQIGLLEALEAIEDDTTEDEDGEEEEEEEEGDDENGENTGENVGTEARANENAGQLLANGPASTSSLDNANNNNNSNVDFSSAIEVVQDSSTAADGEQQNKTTINEQNIGAASDQQQQLLAVQGEQPEQLAHDAEVPLAEVVAQEGVEEELNEQQQQVQLRLQEARNLGAQHHALLRFRDNNTSEDYVRPNMFPLRIVLLLFCVALTAEAIALLFFFVPVTIGRAMLSCLALTNQPVHDLYTVAAGLYTCWLLARMAMLSREWARKGWSYVKKVFSSALWLLLRIFAAALPLLVVIPFMLGFYFQMLVISPLRVAIFQSPLFFPWKEWAMGVVHFKIICASVLMGPDWWLKTAFEQIYADGIWNFRLRDLYLNLVFPIINALAFLIAYPYALSKFVLMFIDTTREEEVIVTRYSYPFLLGSICALAFLTWQWQKLKMLAQKIRNDKYLIGTQLVNFYRDSTPAVPTVTATALIEATMATATSSATKDDAAVDVGGESSAATLANNEAVATAEGNTHGEQESRAEIGGAVEVLD